MPISTISSREFNQDVSKAKRRALSGPVYITDRGVPRHVLMSIDDYERLTGCRTSVVEMLSMPEAADIELPLDRGKSESLQQPDLAGT